MRRRVRRTATPERIMGSVHRRPPLTLPSKGRGREWATGTGEAVLPPGARPQAAGTDGLALRRWVRPPPRRGGGKGGAWCSWSCGLIVGWSIFRALGRFSIVCWEWITTFQYVHARSSGDARARAGLAHDAMCVSTMYRVSLVSLSAGCAGCCWRTMRASGEWICSELGWSELRRLGVTFLSVW